MHHNSPFQNFYSSFSLPFRPVPLLLLLTFLMTAAAGCSDSGGSHNSPPALPTAASLPASCTSVGAGAGYNCSISVTGGNAPFTWTVSGLPAGLNFAISADTKTLTITGTAPAQAVRTASRPSPNVVAAAASSSATVQIGVTDAKGRTASITLSISIEALSITTSSLPNGTQGVAYSASVSASGGASPYTWTITGLPTGLNASGPNISGTPTQSGTFNITVKVTDSEVTPVNIQVTLSLTISAPPALAISTTTLPGGTAGASYSTTVTATGGVTPYHWTITGLPSGITFTSATPSASVSGTTDDVGTFTVTASVTDSASTAASDSATLTLTIAQAAALVITTTTFPNGTINVAYNQTLNATGGIAPYTWTKTGGNLPAGLSLATTGMISGTPTAEGTSSFTLQVADSESPAQMKTVNLSITINAVAAGCALSGKQLALEVTGSDSTGFAAWVGSVKVASDNSVTGKLDFRNQSAVSANQSISGAAGSCMDGTVAKTGSLTFTAGGVTRTIDYAMRSDGMRGFVLESDSSGFSGTGEIQVQTAPTTPVDGSYAFGLQGASTSAFFYVTGAACTNSSGGVIFLQADFAVTGTLFPTVAGSSSPGAFSMPDANGRFTTTSPLSYTNGTTVDTTGYNIDGSKAYVLNTGGSYPGGSIPAQVGFLTGKPGSSCLPRGQGGSFSNSSLGNSVFSAQGVASCSGCPLTVGAFVGVVNDINAAAGTATITSDQLIFGTGSMKNSAQPVTYSVSSVGRLDLATMNSSGKTAHSFAYLDGNGNAYLIPGDPNGRGIAFGFVQPQTATTLALGTFAYGTELLTIATSPTFLPVTEVSFTGTTITDMSSGGSTGNYTCDTIGRCTAPSLNNSVTFGDNSIVFYVGGPDFILVLQTKTANAVGGTLLQ